MQSQLSSQWMTFKPTPVIGVDEAGRGCLAGPVCAAAVILNGDRDTDHFNDSKKITAKRRELLFEELIAHHKVAIAFSSVETIAEMNILQAALKAMGHAVLDLGVDKGSVLVDGNQKIPGLAECFVQTTVIGGDGLYAPIAAASICAKVARDRVMLELDQSYPEYAFSRHKGYSTPLHKQKIREFGPTRVHRKTFAGVREFWRSDLDL